MMKTSGIILIILIALILGFFIAQSCQDSDLKNEIVSKEGIIKELAKDTTEISKENRELQVKIDSLLKVPEKIKTKYIIKDKEISDDILKDSANAIVHFRNGLVLWDWLPDASDYPTLREIGIGGRIASLGHGFKLQVKEYESEIVPALKTAITGLNLAIGKRDEMITEKDDIILIQNNEIEDLTSFWNSRLFGIILGILATLGIVLASNL